MVKKLNNSNVVNINNNICKSESKNSGKNLRIAHYKLGFLVGKNIIKNEKMNNKKIAIIIMMRAGMPFGMGVADALEKRNIVNIMFSNIKNSDYNKFDYIIIADAVLNTGKTICSFIPKEFIDKIIIAINVISKEGCKKMKNYKTYVSRISNHSYKGSLNKKIDNGRGPDTGDRLYDSSFFL